MKTQIDGYPEDEGDEPIIFSQLAWDRLDVGVMYRVKHAHVMLTGGTRYCVKRAGSPCVAGLWS